MVWAESFRQRGKKAQILWQAQALRKSCLGKEIEAHYAFMNRKSENIMILSYCPGSQ